MISKYGDGIPLAIRMAQDGNIVKIWIKDKEARKSLNGFRNPSKVSDPYKMLDQYDLVLNDMVGTGSVCDTLSSKGKLVLGGGSFNDKLELDREYGSKVAQTLTEAAIPPTVSINTKEELIKFFEKTNKPQVIKPLGNKQTNLTLVSRDKENRMLKSVIAKRAAEFVPCIVQETVEGIDISTEGWFNGKEWVKPFNHTIESKRFMEGDKGCQTGCMGNIVWPTTGDKLTSTVLEPLSSLLEKVNYVGPIDVNCIVTEESAYFLEYTARFGYDAIQAWSELIKASIFDYLYGIASAQKDSFTYHNEYAIAVRLTIHPFPGKGEIEDLSAIRVIDPPQAAMKHVWLADVSQDEDTFLMAGVDGVIGAVTSRGISVRECQRRAYRTINNITLSDDVQYRNDIGNNVEDDKKKLIEFGWLNA